MQNSASNLQTQAYQQIKNNILQANYEPGQKISEKDIEADVGIGRTPVREALIHLRHDGLIDVIPQSGTFISLIDLHAAVAARFVRENIESKVVMEASNRISAEDALDFTEIMQQQKQQIKQQNVAGFFDTDEAFHRKFYEITDKRIVWDWLQSVNIHLNRFRWLRLKVAQLDWNMLEDQHTAILNAVKNHDIDEAGFLASRHLHLMLEEQQTLLDTFPEYFKQNEK